VIPVSRAHRVLNRHGAVRVRTLAYWLVLCCAFFAPLDSLRLGGFGGAADAFLLAAFALLALQWTATRRPLRLGPYVQTLLAALLLVVGGLVGTFFSPAATTSVANIARFTITVCGLPWAMAALVPSRRDVLRIAWAYVLGCTLSALVSMTSASPVTGRSSGLSSHPNVLGMSSAFALLILLGLRDTLGPRRRLAALGVLALLLVAISRSGSRAAVVILVVGGLAYLAMSRRRRQLGVLLAAGVLLGTALLAGLYEPDQESALGRVLYRSEGTLRSDEGRAELAATVLERIDDNLVTGSGFALATQAHNIYLQILDTAGLIGVLAFAALIASILRAQLRRRSDPLVAGALAMYLGYLAAGLFSNTLWDRWLWIPIVVGLAAAATARTSAQQAAMSGACVSQQPVAAGGPT
jgi:O-antigen ligase